MKCPKCGRELKTITSSGVEIDYCLVCKGVWFDYPEIEQLSDTIKEFNIIAPRPEKLKIMDVDEKTRKCPRCGADMYKVTMMGRPPVFDCCPEDHGYWFDEHEIKEYIQNNMTAVQKQKGEELLNTLKQY